MTLSTYDELQRTVAARLQHAASRGQELADAIQDWMRRDPFWGEPSIASDRLSWELRLRYREPPPLRKWGHTFGDAVGALRSTLNNLLWGIAQVEGIALKKPKALQFPIAETSEQWASQAAWVAELPVRVQEAIELIQPFQRTGPNGLPQNDALLLLRRLSNTDKHQLALEAVIDPRELSHMLAVEFHSEEEAAAEGEPRVEINVSFNDGDIVLRQVTRHPIAKVSGAHSFSAQVVVLDPPHGSVGVTAGLAVLCAYADQVCAYVLACQS